MKKNDPDPRYFLLAACLRQRGFHAIYNARLDRDISGQRRYKELKVVAPLLACHHIHPRRLAVCIGTGLECWRERMDARGIDLLSVSADGVLSNARGIADIVSHRLYRLHPDDLREMLDKKMSLSAISKVTGMSSSAVWDKIRFYFRQSPEEAICGSPPQP